MNRFIQEEGTWTAGTDTDQYGYVRVWIDSSDFHHDARLQISGDFANDAIKFAYAEEIAERLNEWKQRNDNE